MDALSSGATRASVNTMMHITSYETLLEHEIDEEIKVVFQRRFGQKLTEFRFDRLSRTEQEWVVHNASVNVQQRRKEIV